MSFSFLHHLFIPHHRNNHRAKLLHNSSLLLLILFISFFTAVSFYLKTSYPQVLGISYSISSQDLLTLVNKEREARSLSSLKMNDQLSAAAAGKADHMFANNYWAHFAPDGTSPWYFIKSAGYSYVYAGENLAKGFTSSTDAVEAWMNSPTHKANILSPQYEDMGFAIKEGTLQGEDTVLIVQMFGAKSNPAFALQQDDGTLEIVGKQQQEPVPTTQAGLLGESGAKPVSSSGLIKTNAIESNPLINSVFTSKMLSYAILAIIVSALLLDFIIVERKRIPRIVGNNVDHIILLVLFLLFIFVMNFSSIL